VPVRGPLVRVLLWSGALGGGALGVVGGLSLRAPGLVAVGLAGTLAACAAVGIARESGDRDRRSVAEAAVQAAGWTVGGLFVLAGIAVLAGGGLAVLVVGAAFAGWLVRAALRGRPTEPPPPAAPATAAGNRVDVDHRAPSGPVGAGRLPVSMLSTSALGHEWLTTTAAMAGPLEPAARQFLISRREEILDELERRDPEGFARWLAVGPTRGNDPAEYVRGGPVHDGPAASPDAV
jgi:hypothetical protein